MTLAELFGDKDTLVIYSYMFGPQREKPCPMCTSFMGSWEGKVPDIEQRVALAMVARSPIERLVAAKKARGWTQLKVYSDADGDFTRDYVSAADADVPGYTVFTRRDGTIRHFWSGEMGGEMADPGQDPRGAPDLDPLWTLLDTTPEGRGAELVSEARLPQRRVAAETGGHHRPATGRGPFCSVHAYFGWVHMESHDDDDLSRFEADGAAPLPVTHDQGYVEHDGARIWYATYGSGPPVILLHGGLGHSGNWGYQVPALVRSGYRAVLIDSRGHGRSTRDARPFTYELMASDVSAVMDALQLEKAGLVGWSDGACTALILASKAPTRVAGVFFFACNMDPSGTKEIRNSLRFSDRCFSRHVQGLRTAIGHAGPIRRVFRRGRPDAENATQLFGE